MKTNLVELCSDIAGIITAKQAECNKEECEIDMGDTLIYNDKYQKIFDNHYDNIWGYLEEEGFKHENT